MTTTEGPHAAPPAPIASVPAGVLGLVSATPPSLVRSLADSRVVIGGVDGTHMGLAVNWWQSEVEAAGPDADVRAEIRETVTPSEALRSAIEVILALADWIARNDHESSGDSGLRLLRFLSTDPLLRPSQRILCADLASSLELNPDATDFPIHRADVDAAMRLVTHLSRAVEQRFSIPVADQLSVFRDAVLRLARAPHAPPSDRADSDDGERS